MLSREDLSFEMALRNIVLLLQAEVMSLQANLVRTLSSPLRFAPGPHHFYHSDRRRRDGVFYSQQFAADRPALWSPFSPPRLALLPAQCSRSRADALSLIDGIVLSAAGKAVEIFLAVLPVLEYVRQSGSTQTYLEVREAGQRSRHHPAGAHWPRGTQSFPLAGFAAHQRPSTRYPSSCRAPWPPSASAPRRRSSISPHGCGRRQRRQLILAAPAARPPPPLPLDRCSSGQRWRRSSSSDITSVRVWFMSVGE